MNTLIQSRPVASVTVASLAEKKNILSTKLIILVIKSAGFLTYGSVQNRMMSNQSSSSSSSASLRTVISTSIAKQTILTTRMTTPNITLCNLKIWKSKYKLLRLISIYSIFTAITWGCIQYGLENLTLICLSPHYVNVILGYYGAGGVFLEGTLQSHWARLCKMLNGYYW